MAHATKLAARRPSLLPSILFGLAAMVTLFAAIYNIHLQDSQNKTFSDGIGIAGTVTSVRQNHYISGRTGNYDVTVGYHYATLDGRHSYDGSGNLNGPILNGLKVGSTLTVIYSQHNPARSLLLSEMPTEHDTYGLVAFSMVLFLISGALFVGYRVRGRALKRSRDI